MPKPRTNGRLILAAVLALVLLPLVILARPALRSEERATQVTVEEIPSPEISPSALDQAGDNTASACTADCEATPTQAQMHLADVRGEVHTDPYGHYLLVVYVVVHGSDHAPLGQVKVNASIWCPNGGPAYRTRITRNSNGTARFHWGSTEPGHWKLCVDSLTREGYVYEPGAGEVSSCAEWSN
jgi:hypothetical protein